MAKMRRRGSLRWPLEVAAVALTLALCAVQSHAAAPVPAKAAPQIRCGWFDNPTPQNASLVDREGAWTISVQGGHAAIFSKGGGWPPRFSKSQWVQTNAGSYGYGCACMKVTVDAERGTITRIISATAKPLSACRNDPAIRDSEPFNPLK